jgi:sugar/nucleoside kinase (ribokinase family)
MPTTLLVTGSIGIDTVETPFGKRPDALGGSAIYFSYAASFFAPVRLVGAVGEDCPFDLRDVFRGRPVDLAGLEVRKGSKTFRWTGSYLKDMNEATTLKTELNVLGEQAPAIPQAFADSRFVFLANTHPSLQQKMIGSVPGAQLIVADTMNLWINIQRPQLLELLAMIHGLVLNEGEAKLLTGRKNLVDAARDVLRRGPQWVVIKKGEHGCLLCGPDGVFALPAFPADRVVDPTGAGDSFAGGMMGYLAACGECTPATLRRAIAYGTVVASYTIADFSLEALRAVSRADIDARLDQLRAATSF